MLLQMEKMTLTWFLVAVLLVAEQFVDAAPTDVQSSTHLHHGFLPLQSQDDLPLEDIPIIFPQESDHILVSNVKPELAKENLPFSTNGKIVPFSNPSEPNSASGILDYHDVQSFLSDIGSNCDSSLCEVIISNGDCTVDVQCITDSFAFNQG